MENDEDRGPVKPDNGGRGKKPKQWLQPLAAELQVLLTAAQLFVLVPLQVWHHIY